MGPVKVLSLALLVLLGLPLVAAAQSGEARAPPCTERGHVVEHLRNLSGERALGRGLADQGVVFELYASGTGSWTLFITTPQGKSCFVASGQAWEPVPEPDLFARR
jgi:hypothetical protein